MPSLVQRNILANAVGGIWTTLLNLALIPLQTRLLGPEAYGLLSGVASLQILFTIFDLGLSTTVIREVASDLSPARQNSLRLLQTIHTSYWIIGLLLGGALGLASDWIARDWLELRALASGEAVQGLRVLALTIAVRWPIAVYSGALTGAQQLTPLNALRIIAASLRLGGGIVILLIRPVLMPFLVWQACSALIELALFIIICRQRLPGFTLRPGLSLALLRRIGRFSLEMNLVSILAIVFTQADKVLISKFLPLEDLGYYSVAYNLASGLALIQGFVTTAMLPALAGDFARADLASLHRRYQQATQILVSALTLPAGLMVFFGHDLLQAWVSSAVAERASLTLALLSAAFWLNASLSIPYTLAVATGHARLPLIANLLAAPLYPFALYALVVYMGIAGAAAAFALLNLFYFFVLLPRIDQAILRAGVWAWLWQCLLPFLSAGLIIFGLGRLIVQWSGASEGWLVWGVACLAAGAYGIGAFRLLEPSLRQSLVQLMRRAVGLPAGVSA